MQTLSIRDHWIQGFVSPESDWVVKHSSPKSFFMHLCLSCSPLDTRVSLAPLAMNTGLRSEMGLAVMMFPPMDWWEQAESESCARMQGRRWQLWQGHWRSWLSSPVRHGHWRKHRRLKPKRLGRVLSLETYACVCKLWQVLLNCFPSPNLFSFWKDWGELSPGHKEPIKWSTR